MRCRAIEQGHGAVGVAVGSAAAFLGESHRANSSLIVDDQPAASPPDWTNSVRSLPRGRRTRRALWGNRARSAAFASPRRLASREGAEGGDELPCGMGVAVRPVGPQTPILAHEF